MAINVVRGASAGSSSTTDSQRQLDTQQKLSERSAVQHTSHSATVATSANVISTIARSADAVVTSVRTLTKASGSKEERIKDFGEAKKVAEEVAERVRGSDSSSVGGTHGELSSTQAQGHLD